jgi:membrane protein
MNAADIADQLGIPPRLVRDIIYNLMNARIINETLNQEVREVAYQPAIDPSKISISFVIDALDKLGQQVAFDKESPEFEQITSVVESFYDDIRSSPRNILLKDL